MTSIGRLITKQRGAGERGGAGGAGMLKWLQMGEEPAKARVSKAARGHVHGRLAHSEVRIWKI